MKAELIDILRCPSCSGSLTLDKACYDGNRVENGILRCAGCAGSYPIAKYIPRFVPSENYANTFGFQWNQFGKTQLDSHSGHPISFTRFFRTTGWNPESMRDKWVLDIGCGAGRFTEVALSTGASVVALDYSNAVDVCRDNLFPNEKLEIVQGDIYHLPLLHGKFDFVYCLGVLQHTPRVKEAFTALSKLPCHHGQLAIDIYPKQFRNIFFSKYWIRPITRNIESSRLLPICERLVDICIPVSTAIGRIPVIGKKLRYLIPVANYDGIYPLLPQQLREWAILDTFDMLASKHDKPQTIATLKEWFSQAQFKNVEVFRSFGNIGRGEKP